MECDWVSQSTPFPALMFVRVTFLSWGHCWMEWGKGVWLLYKTKKLMRLFYTIVIPEIWHFLLTGQKNQSFGEERETWKNLPMHWMAPMCLIPSCFSFSPLLHFEFCLFRLIYKSGINQANSLIHITVLTTLVEFKISTEETYSSISKKETQDKLLAS